MGGQHDDMASLDRKLIRSAKLLFFGYNLNLWSQNFLKTPPGGVGAPLSAFDWPNLCFNVMVFDYPNYQIIDAHKT